jgi:hypothetical protein
VIFSDILRELLDYDLGGVSFRSRQKSDEPAFVLLIGLGDLPRLLRLSLLYRPFLRGVRLGERGEIVRRSLEGDLESGLSSEYGDRVRGRPRVGDREGMLTMEL